MRTELVRGRIDRRREPHSVVAEASRDDLGSRMTHHIPVARDHLGVDRHVPVHAIEQHQRFDSMDARRSFSAIATAPAAPRLYPVNKTGSAGFAAFRATTKS